MNSFKSLSLHRVWGSEYLLKQSCSSEFEVLFIGWELCLLTSKPGLQWFGCSNFYSSSGTWSKQPLSSKNKKTNKKLSQPSRLPHLCVHFRKQVTLSGGRGTYYWWEGIYVLLSLPTKLFILENSLKCQTVWYYLGVIGIPCKPCWGAALGKELWLKGNELWNVPCPGNTWTEHLGPSSCVYWFTSFFACFLISKTKWLSMIAIKINVKGKANTMLSLISAQYKCN